MQNAGLPGNGKKMLVGSKKDLFFFKKNFLSFTSIPYLLFFY